MKLTANWTGQDWLEIETTTSALTSKSNRTSFFSAITYNKGQISSVVEYGKDNKRYDHTRRQWIDSDFT